MRQLATPTYAGSVLALIGLVWILGSALAGCLLEIRAVILDRQRRRDMLASRRVVVRPVGVMEQLAVTRRLLRHAPAGVWVRAVAGQSRYQARRLAVLARAGQWRDLRAQVRGYVAEPAVWPEGLTRPGTGWTRQRALTDLRQRMWTHAARP